MVRGDKFGRKGKPLIKILFVTSWYPNRVHTQDGNFVREYAEAVGAIHPVTLLHVVEDPAVATVITERHDRTWGKVIQVCYPGARTRVQRIGSRSRAWQVALSEVSAERFDLIHAHVLIDGGIVADSFARRRKIPFVISTHSHRYLEPCPWLRLPELWLARRAARRAAFLLPVSPSLQGGMQGHRIRGNYRVLPNLVDDTVFHPATTTTESPFTFLHVSDFSDNKRAPLLLEHFADLARGRSDVVLRLAGNEIPPDLPHLIRSLHLRPRQIVLSGPHTRPEIAELMRSADAFLLNSRVETQSVVLLEALLSGLACISTRCGGPEDILDQPEFGRLVPVFDDAAYREALQDLLTAGKPNLARRQEISTLARARYGQSITLGRLLEIYATAAEGNSKIKDVPSRTLL